MRNKRFIESCLLYLFALFAIGMLMAEGCRGGGEDRGAGGPQLVKVGGQKYNAAASLGELLVYQLNPSTVEFPSPRYSFLFMEGDFAGGRGHGTMSRIPNFGNYVYQTSPDPASIVLRPDALALIAPGNGNGLIAGVPALTTGYTVDTITGLYNVLAYALDPALPNDTYHFELGSFQMNADGTWVYWGEALAPTLPADNVDDAGTWLPRGNGVLAAYRGATKVANLMLLPGTGGGKIIVLDHCDTHWKGLGLGLPRVSVNRADYAGLIYDVLATDADTVFYATMAPSGSTVVMTPPGRAPQVSSLIYNSPWDGFISFSDGSRVLADPAGFLFGGYVDSASALNADDRLWAAIKE